MSDDTSRTAPAPGTSDVPRSAGPTTAGPTTGGPTTAGPAASTSAGFQPLWDAMRRTGVRRPSDDRWLGGVCAGVARRLGVDPVLLRVAVIALTLLGGAGVVAYAIALLLLPDHDGRIELERAAWGDLTGTTVGAVALLLLAVVVPGPWDLWRGGPVVDGGELAGALVLGTLLLIGLAFLPKLREQLEGPGTPTAGATAPGTHPTGPTGPTGPAASWSAPPPPPRPSPTPQRRGPGPALSAAATGTALVAGGAVWLAAEADLVLGRPWLMGAIAALTVLGVALLALGLAGRRDGSVGGAASLVVLVTVTALLVPSWRTLHLAGDVTWSPETRAAAERGGTVGLGEGVLDLSGLADLPAGAGVEVPVRVGIGQLVVRVPEGMDVTVRAGSLVGTVRDADTTVGPTDGEGGVGVEATLLRASDPQVVVDARALVGDVDVVVVQP